MERLGELLNDDGGSKIFSVKVRCFHYSFRKWNSEIGERESSDRCDVMLMAD